IRTTPDARTEGEWGFEHTKAVFNNEIIPFLKSLKDILNMFDRDLLNEITEVKTVFDQMDVAVQQSSVDKQCLEIAKKELILENNRLLQQIMSQEVLLIVMNSMSLIGESVNMDGKRKESCNLEAELLKLQNAFNDLLKSYSQLEKHCIYLELSIQLNQEIFQKDESFNNQYALEIPEFFENNDLKAQLQDKDNTIYKLKDIIKSMREKSKEENVKYDYCEIETKNIELENSVAKLILENERLSNEINHVKQVYKEQFDSIKKTLVRTKEQTKRKEIVDIAAQIPSANTIVPGMFKLDLEPLAPRLLVQTQNYKVKKVRFVEPLTSSSNIKQVESSTTSDSNTPVLSATGLKCSTSNYGSKPTGDKRNDRISITSANVVPPKKTTSHSVETQKPELKVVQIVLWYLDSGCSKHMTGNRFQLMNFDSKFLGIVRFENDHIAKIIGYGDYELGNVTISRLYYVEGLGHNLFSVGQFCDLDLEVAFWKNTCFICNLEGVDLLSGSRNTNLYIISLDDMLKTSSICLLSKASKTKSWLWHHCLSHLNFGTLNKLAKDGLARGIPRLKFQKDHLCSACALGKSKKSSHQPKAEDTNQEKLYLLHMDLCGPMCVASINSKSNKSFPACCVKSFGLIAPLEKCYEIRNLDSMSYHVRGACLRP
ncbi:retrovirus-related pol polyprotein from transposon TNT 1-94, partial [Tanacetum coccineum]